MNSYRDNSIFGSKRAHASGIGLPGRSGPLRAAVGLPGRNCKSAMAFTLVEMLVAILILVVSVALVVGVGSMVREHSQSEQTRNIQAVLRSALRAYHKTETPQAWPAGDGKPDSTAGLLTALRKNQTARSELAKLPQQATSVDSAGREFVMDGFGNRLLYDQTGGLAGAPLLISLGPDKNDPADDINVDVN